MFIWQHGNFGQLTMNGISIFFLWNFHTTCAEGVASRPNNFHNFWVHGYKVIEWYVFFIEVQAAWAAQKIYFENHYFQNKKIQKFKI